MLVEKARVLNLPVLRAIGQMGPFAFICWNSGSFDATLLHVISKVFFFLSVVSAKGFDYCLFLVVLFPFLS